MRRMAVTQPWPFPTKMANLVSVHRRRRFRSTCRWSSRTCSLSPSRRGRTTRGRRWDTRTARNHVLEVKNKLANTYLVFTFFLSLSRLARVKDPMHRCRYGQRRLPHALPPPRPPGDPRPDVQRPSVPAQVERVRFCRLLKVVRRRRPDADGQLHPGTEFTK
jgi:hypothetical protein